MCMVLARAYGHVHGHEVSALCTHMRIDVCIDVCANMCLDMCLDMCVGMCIDMGRTCATHD